MFNWIRRLNEKRIKRQQERKMQAELDQIRHEKLLENCKKGDHNWEETNEIQGDGDPNVEGYIMITRTTCTVCGETEVNIEPYDKSDE